MGFDPSASQTSQTTTRKHGFDTEPKAYDERERKQLSKSHPNNEATGASVPVHSFPEPPRPLTSEKNLHPLVSVDTITYPRPPRPSTEARAHPLLFVNNQAHSDPQPDTRSKIKNKAATSNVDAQHAHPLLLLSTSKHPPNCEPSSKARSSDIGEDAYPLLLLSASSSNLNHKADPAALKPNSPSNTTPKTHPLTVLPKKPRDDNNSSSNAEMHPLLLRTAQLPKTKGDPRAPAHPHPNGLNTHVAMKDIMHANADQARPRFVAPQITISVWLRVQCSPPNVEPRVCLLNRRDIASAPPGASCTSKNELQSIVSFLILVSICSASRAL